MGKTDERLLGLTNLIFALFSNYRRLILETTDPADFVEEQLLNSLSNILNVKHRFEEFRWSDFIAFHMRDMLSSHEEYITHVMFACYFEEYIDSNIFERYLNVCCVTNVFSALANCMAGVNFHQSNVDIIMVYYEKKLKKKFNKCGGYRQLVEYILQHEYATWELRDTDQEGFYDTRTSQVITIENLKAMFAREAKKLQAQRPVYGCGSREMTIATSLASEVLSIAKTKLPILPSPEDLVARLCEYAKEEIAEKQGAEKMVQNPNDFDVHPPGKPILNSSSEPKEAEPKMNNALCEKIVEAVVRHNISKSSLKASSDNIFYIEACQVLHHLKDTVKSLIEVLEQIDKN